MFRLKSFKLFRIFLAIGILLLAQVIWWNIVFLQDVKTIQTLRLSPPSAVENTDSILEQSSRRTVMFVSESVFFVLMSFLGLMLLYRALKLEKKSKEIQHNFIEILSHESNTPLTALKLRLESIQEKLGASHPLQRDTVLALDEVRRLSQLMDKTQSLNRLEREVLRKEKIQLAELIHDLIQRLEPFLKKKNATVKLEIKNEATIFGDPYFIQNLIQSLLENAVLYNAQAQSLVTITLSQKAKQVQLDIKDNGPGIDIQDRAHLFEKFYRGRAGKNVPGTGLGLYIAKMVAEAHQGSLRCMDCNQGSHFQIHLPGTEL